MEFFEQFRNLDVQAIQQQAQAIWTAGPQLVMIAGAAVGLVFLVFLTVCFARGSKIKRLKREAGETKQLHNEELTTQEQTLLANSDQTAQSLRRLIEATKNEADGRIRAQQQDHESKLKAAQTGADQRYAQLQQAFDGYKTSHGNEVDTVRKSLDEKFIAERQAHRVEIARLEDRLRTLVFGDAATNAAPQQTAQQTVVTQAPAPQTRVVEQVAEVSAPVFAMKQPEAEEDLTFNRRAYRTTYDSLAKQLGYVQSCLNRNDAVGSARYVSDAARVVEALQSAVPSRYAGSAQALGNKLQNILEQVAGGNLRAANRSLSELNGNLQLLDESVNA